MDEEFILSSEVGLQILDALMGKPDVNRIAVLPGDSARYLEKFYPARIPPFLSGLMQSASPVVESISIRHRLEQSTEKEYEGVLIDFIRGSLADVLRMEPAKLDVQKFLNAMGLDSLRAVEFRNRIRTELNIDISMANLMKGISVLDLARQIGTLLVGVLPAADNAASENSVSNSSISNNEETLLGKLESDQLSGEEIDTLFDKYFG